MAFRNSSESAQRSRGRASPARPAALALLASLLLLAPAAPAAAQAATAQAAAPPSFTMEAAVAAALQRSATVVDARASVDAARLALELSAPWRSSSLGARVGLASPQAPATESELSWSLQASAPLATGLSLSASLSPSSLGASASVKPFATADLRARDTVTRSLVQAAEAERLASIQARSAYRAAWLAILDLAAKEKSLEAAEARAEAASLNAAAGAASSSDVIDADSRRIDAMVALLDARDKAGSALQDLSRLVGRTVDRAELAEPDPGAGRTPQAKEEYLARLAGLATLGLDLAAAERSAKPVMPDLSLSGGVTRQTDPRGLSSVSWSASASLTLDPDTFLRGRDRASALELQRIQRKAAESRTDAAEEYASLLARIGTARSALESAERIGTTARLAFEKSSYLAEAGTVSGTSLLDSRVSLLAAEYRVAKARADLGAALDALDGGLGSMAALAEK